MRPFKMILAGLFAAIAVIAAVAAGFVAAAVVAAVGFTVYVLRRLIGAHPATPRAPVTRNATVRSPDTADAIEVTATEVHADQDEHRLGQ